MTKSRFRLTAVFRVGELGATQAEIASLSLGRSALVFGSPGSGKTDSAIALAANLIRRYSAGDVLLISATRNAAAVVRDRLAIELQTVTAGALSQTLSSFAFELLQHNRVARAVAAPVLLTGAEQERLVAELIENVPVKWPSLVTPLVRGLSSFRSQLRELIAHCIELEITPEHLRSLAHQQAKPIWLASAEIYDAYLQNLPEGTIDPSALLLEATELIRSKQVNGLPKIVLVDDAQELTPAAFRLIEALGREADLVLFGDPDAATQGFRFSDPQAMAKLIRAAKADYVEFVLPPRARPVALSNALAKISEQISTALAGVQRRGLKLPEAADDQSVSINKFVGQSDEHAFLATQLRKLHLLEGVSYRDIAVVARSRNTLERLAMALANQELPVVLNSAGTALAKEFASRSLLLLAQKIMGEPGEIDYEELISSPFSGFDVIEIQRLKRALLLEVEPVELESTTVLKLLFSSPGEFHDSRSALVRRAARFAQRIVEAQVIGAEPGSVDRMLYQLWNGSDPQANWLNQCQSANELATQAHQNLNAIVALFAAADRFAERNPNAAATQFVTEQLSLNIAEDTLAPAAAEADAITLTTPTGLIGNQFEVIFLPELVEGIWPNLKPRNSIFETREIATDESSAEGSVLVDELRMFYKAVGAARKSLFITAVENDDDQISQFARLCGVIPEEPVRFEVNDFSLRNQVAALRRGLVVASSKSEKSASTHNEDPAVSDYALALAKLANNRIPGAHPDSWYGLVSATSFGAAGQIEPSGEQRLLSPSQLENFEKCPLHWFLSVVGAEQKNTSASLGTLLHQLFESERINPRSDKAEVEFLAELENRWAKLKFESDWLEAREKRRARQAVINMVEYLRKFEFSESKVIGREIPFEVQLPSAVLRGKVDRIEIEPDGTVVIADLKTSKQLPNAADVAVHTQLASYQLAFELGAFDEILKQQGVSSGRSVAKLIGIGASKLTEKRQAGLSGNVQAKQKIERLLIQLQQLSLEQEGGLTAQVGTHCKNQHEFGSCKIHLVPAVSYVE